jgi:cysteinyl-tRNA synthetase
MANVWMHNGFLELEGRKMAKSEGNFITIRELLADWPGEVLRFNMLRTHYRQPLDWTVRGLEESYRILSGFFGFSDIIADAAQLHASVEEALLDDLNTPDAINRLHELDKSKNAAALIASLRALGFSGRLADPRKSRLDKDLIESMIAARNTARAARNWKESDRIRDELAALGVTLKDSKDGTTWEVKR